MKFYQKQDPKLFSSCCQQFLDCVDLIDMNSDWDSDKIINVSHTEIRKKKLWPMTPSMMKFANTTPVIKSQIFSMGNFGRLLRYKKNTCYNHAICKKKKKNERK